MTMCNLRGLACPVLLAAGVFCATSFGASPAEPLIVSATRAPDKPWSDFPTRVLASLPDYTPQADGALSAHGGLKSAQRSATGFFRAEKSGARWWLIDPEGCQFINVAVVNVNIPPGSATVNAALQEKYGTRAAWAEAALAQLREHGFNGTGAWSADPVLRTSPRPVVYTAIWNFMSEYGKRRGGTYQMSGHIGYPKGAMFAFDPEFVAFCDEFAARNIAPLKDDPWLLGHFSDNELPFYQKSLDNFLSLPETDAGHVAAGAWLAQRRASGVAGAAITEEDRQAFLGFLAERYLSITSAAIRKYDPNHILLGPRFNAYELGVESVFAAAGRHLDVIAINYYRIWTPDPARMRQWVEWSGKPFLVTEWYAKGMDSGYTNMSGAGWTVKTQQDRGRFYQNFTLGLLESGGCVGWHWFRYMDNDPEDKTTDPSNRDSNKGIVTIRFSPYLPLLEAMKEVNSQVHSLVKYFDGRKP